MPSRMAYKGGRTVPARFINLGIFTVCILTLYIFIGSHKRPGEPQSSANIFGFVPAYSKACYRPHDSNTKINGGHPLPLETDDGSATPFDLRRPTTLLIDCSHNHPEAFNPFHWSNSVWPAYSLLLNDSIAVKEIFVPCRAEDLHVASWQRAPGMGPGESPESLDWPSLYWGLLEEEAKKRNVPIRFGDARPQCISNAIHLRGKNLNLGAVELIEPARAAALARCGLARPPDVLARRSDPGAVDVMVLERQDIRSFTSGAVREFKERARALGLVVNTTTVPRGICDQLRLFSSGLYPVLLSPHGAQMTNYVMLAPKTTVYEFWSTGFHIRIYCKIAESNGGHWYHVYREGILKGPIRVDDQCIEKMDTFGYPCMNYKLCRGILRRLPIRMHDAGLVAESALQALAKLGLEPLGKFWRKDSAAGGAGGRGPGGSGASSGLRRGRERALNGGGSSREEVSGSEGWMEEAGAAGTGTGRGRRGRSLRSS